MVAVMSKQPLCICVCKRDQNLNVSVLAFCLFCVTEKFEILQVSWNWWVGWRTFNSPKGDPLQESKWRIHPSSQNQHTGSFYCFVWFSSGRRGLEMDRWLEKFLVCCWSRKHPEQLCCAQNSWSLVWSGTCYLRYYCILPSDHKTSWSEWALTSHDVAEFNISHEAGVQAPADNGILCPVEWDVESKS